MENLALRDVRNVAPGKNMLCLSFTIYPTEDSQDNETKVTTLYVIIIILILFEPLLLILPISTISSIH